ncbi:alpha/beta fold hydrolase [Leptospira langatensis]|uniref:Alpha/beta fold hydrolase n=1 Tax=Leptospira langatensis TaxID=2484983 RepID=A0A5F1ZZ95_9LEPT|nr:alpha/beta fold hydrolase [Leptospira langatensis]TGK04090.1 alpha/beta fold hydrolase [Leptospira langatensis]TGL43570.1 alpha/beta fold hydrolase [Leptospira langatensis]
MSEKVKLAFKEHPLNGTPKFSCPILILHGLFGSSKNWMSVADYLSEYSTVFSLDLRNHGDSPHSSDHTLHSMSADILGFLEDHSIPKAIVLGHSMGGLVAMTFALEHPEKVDTLIIQDIAPRDYPFDYDAELAVLGTDVSKYKNRQEIDQVTAPLLPNPFIRNFLLMNLERTESGYKWKLNVDGISSSRRMFQSQFPGNEKKYLGRVLFILGGSSEYFIEGDREISLSYFPNASFQTIPGGDHYIHFTKALEYQKILTGFLDSLPTS